MREGIKLGVVWLLVVVSVDLLTVPFLAGWEYFADWRAHIHYPLPVIIVPLVTQRRIISSLPGNSTDE